MYFKGEIRTSTNNCFKATVFLQCFLTEVYERKYLLYPNPHIKTETKVF